MAPITLPVDTLYVRMHSFELSSERVRRNCPGPSGTAMALVALDPAGKLGDGETALMLEDHVPWLTKPCMSGQHGVLRTVALVDTNKAKYVVVVWTSVFGGTYCVTDPKQLASGHATCGAPTFPHPLGWDVTNEAVPVCAVSGVADMSSLVGFRCPSQLGPRLATSIFVNLHRVR